MNGNGVRLSPLALRSLDLRILHMPRLASLPVDKENLGSVALICDVSSREGQWAEGGYAAERCSTSAGTSEGPFRRTSLGELLTGSNSLGQPLFSLPEPVKPPQIARSCVRAVSIAFRPPGRERNSFPLHSAVHQSPRAKPPRPKFHPAAPLAAPSASSPLTLNLQACAEGKSMTNG